MNPLDARRRLLGRNVYKKTVEGNPAIAQGSLARRYPGITMQGWTEQAQYEGNQLLDKIGIELTNMPKYIPVNVGDGDFTLSTDYVGTAGQKDIFFLAGNVESGAQSNINGVKSGAPRTVTSVDGYVTVAIGKQNDDDLNPENYQIMLNSGSTALPYEPYTGGQPSPNPDYPQEIKNAGKYDETSGKYQCEVKLIGKNMIPSYSELSDWKSSNYMYIPVTGFIIGETYTFSQSVVPNLGEGFYVGLGSVAGDGSKGVMLWLYHSSTPGLCMESGTFVATQETYYLNVSGIYNQSTMTKFLELFPQLMVELGARKTEYESYKEQTVTLTSDRPLTKWDKIEKRAGQWGWMYKSEEIESYTDESVPGEYFSTTGKLSTGAQVWYETTTETFVPLSETEQEALNALHTYYPTTVLSNDCKCEMTLTYKTKKSLEVTT